MRLGQKDQQQEGHVKGASRPAQASKPISLPPPRLPGKGAPGRVSEVA